MTAGPHAVARRRRPPGCAVTITAIAVTACVVAPALDPRPAGAHPLSQGALDVVVRRDRILVEATVQGDEVLIAVAAAGRARAEPDEKLRLHGDYLLAHLTVDADGRRLRGRIVERPAADAERLAYRIEYDVAPGGAPARVVLRQDVMRDLGPAWGGPWDVTFLTAIRQEGDGRPGAPAFTRLLTFAAPVSFDCDWGAPPGDGVAAAQPARLGAAYVRHGIWHILRGYDHLLFVAALLLAAATMWDLVKVVLAFTIAHGTTLALCGLGLIHVREAIVEPLIAASIVVVAVQNIVAPASSRRAPRLVVAFLFGLVHGCGFATGVIGAMRAYSGWNVAVVVVAFSLGVELGHQLGILPAFFLLRRLRARLDTGGGSGAAAAAIQRYGSAAIAAGGAFYFWSALR